VRGLEVLGEDAVARLRDRGFTFRKIKRISRKNQFYGKVFRLHHGYHTRRQLMPQRRLDDI